MSRRSPGCADEAPRDRPLHAGGRPARGPRARSTPSSTCTSTACACWPSTCSTTPTWPTTPSRTPSSTRSADCRRFAAGRRSARGSIASPTRCAWATCAGRAEPASATRSRRRSSAPTPIRPTRYVTRSQVASALARLSPEQRVVVLLVDRDGFDYRSVAEVLDVPKGTVCSRLNAARAALREALTSAQVMPGDDAGASVFSRQRGDAVSERPDQRPDSACWPPSRRRRRSRGSTNGSGRGSTPRRLRPVETPRAPRRLFRRPRLVAACARRGRRRRLGGRVARRLAV